MPYYSPYSAYLILPILLAGLYFLFEKRLTKPWMRWVWWIFSALILLGAGLYASQDQYWYDFFKGYYHGGRKIIRNQDVLYDDACYGYTNFPLIAYIFVPFSKLPKEVAGALFFLIGYISILPLAYWLIKFAGLKGRSCWLVLALLALNGPLDYSIWLGNITQIIMLGILISLWWLKQGREWLAGILLGINGLIKIPLILAAGYFFIRGRWRVVGGGLLITGLVLALSLYLVPFSLNKMWLDKCIFSVAGHPIAAYNNQSVGGVLARELMPGNLGWNPLVPTSQYQWMLRAALLILYAPAVIVLFLGRKLPQTPLFLIQEFFIILTCSLLTSPISWTHYFLLLLIPAAFYMSSDSLNQQTTLIKILFGTSLILLSTPINLTLALFQQTGQYLVLSPHFVGGVLFYLFLLMIWFREYRSLDRCKPVLHTKQLVITMYQLLLHRTSPPSAYSVHIPLARK